MARILIAASPEPRKVLERILAKHRSTSAGDPMQATACLQKVAFDLIICTVRFNDYKMFDFLRLVKDQEEWERIPFVCAQVLSEVPNMTKSSEITRFATKQLGAVSFLDILDYPNNAERQMRLDIESCLAKKPS